MSYKVKTCYDAILLGEKSISSPVSKSIPSRFNFLRFHRSGAPVHFCSIVFVANGDDINRLLHQKRKEVLGKGKSVEEILVEIRTEMQCRVYCSHRSVWGERETFANVGAQPRLISRQLHETESNQVFSRVNGVKYCEIHRPIRHTDC